MRNFFKFYRLYEETHDKDKLIEIKNEILKYACEIDLNLSYKEGYFGEKNALTLACRNKHLDIVILLLNRGADVEERYFAEVHATMDYCYEISYTPLLWACSSGNLNLARLLLDHGANIEAKTEPPISLIYEPYDRTLFDYYYTSLHLACLWGHVDIVALLIEYGANINALSDKNITPLQIRCVYPSKQVDLSHLLDPPYLLK